MSEESCVVYYNNVEFMVVGDWSEGTPDTMYEPGERAGFEDLKILFGTDCAGDDLDIYDFLSVEAQEAIVTLAEEEISSKE